MASRKNFYYVLVMTDEGPVFVTSIPKRNWANYDKNETPKEFGSKSYATEVANGLTLNFNLAYMVCSSYPIENQPYHYEDGGFKWKFKRKK